MAKAKTRRTTPKASRPHMPGYGLPKGTKGLLSGQGAERLLTRSHNYWLITVRPDARPHAMIVWGVWTDGRFLFSTGRQSRKARNLSANPSCVVATDRAADAVIVEGAASEVTDAAVIERAADPYHRKYKPWKLDPEMG